MLGSCIDSSFRHPNFWSVFKIKKKFNYVVKGKGEVGGGVEGERGGE